jgi:hypothetical protein
MSKMENLNQLKDLLIAKIGEDFSLLPDNEQSALVGIAISGKTSAENKRICENPFEEGCLEYDAFVVGYNSSKQEIIIPSFTELLWMDTNIIQSLFRKVTNSSLTVVRHEREAVIFLGSPCDIERVNVICRNAYTENCSITKPRIPTTCTIGQLVICFE